MRHGQARLANAVFSHRRTRKSHRAGVSQAYDAGPFASQDDSSDRRTPIYMTVAIAWSAICLVAFLCLFVSGSPWGVRAFGALFGPTAAAGGVFVYNAWRERKLH